MSESAANMTPYDAAHDDQKKIMDDGVWVPCRIAYPEDSCSTHRDRPTKGLRADARQVD